MSAESGGPSPNKPDAFKSKKEAEATAAKNACEKLQVFQNMAKRTSPSKSINECSPQMKARLKEMVMMRPNGLWQNRLPHEYKDLYGESPPKEISHWSECLPDIIRIEAIEGTARKILYPVASVKLTQSGVSQSVTIKPATLPKPQQELEGGITFCFDPNHFYVQTGDSCIEEVDAQLAEVYENRSAPKPLVSPQVGDFCVAKYEEDNHWYRGHITSIDKEKEMYAVQYVDFGNSSTVSHSQVQRLLDNLATAPAQALRCSLHKVHPRRGQWSKEVQEELMNLLDIPLIMKVIEVQGDVCSVQIYVKTDYQHSFNDRLVRMGLASSHLVPPEPDTLELPESKEWDVYVCYICSPTDVTIRLVGAGHSEKLEALEEELSDQCNETPVEDCREGSMVVLIDKDDDDDVSYHRVRIIACKDDIVEVYYVDHGDRDTVPVSHIRHLPYHLNYLPYQAIPCKLSGLEPYENDEAVLRKLCDMALGTTCVAEVEERLEKISLSLWDTSTEEDININSKVAEVLTTDQLRPALPQVGGRVEGYVTDINQSGHVSFVLSGPGLSKLEELQDEMMKIYGSKEASLFVSWPQEGQLVAAPFGQGENKSWYRALIHEILPGRKVEVFYVDYGNTDKLPFSSLRAPAKEAKFMENLPYQVLKCTVADLPPKETELTEEAIDRLHELLRPDRKIHIEVIEEKDESTGLPKVDIYTSLGEENDDDEGGEEELESVVEILLNEGLFASGYAVNLSRELPPLEMPSSGDQVYVTWCQTPHNFRCIADSNIKVFIEMMSYMLEYYNTNPQTILVPLPQKDGTYAALFNETWYRVIVKTILGLQAAVYFCDYGDCTILPVENLRELASQFWSLPGQAIKAKLAGLQPCDEYWKDDSNNRFIELANQQTHTAWLHNKDENGFIAMTLINTELGGNPFIHKILLEEGLATKPESSSS